RPQHRGHRGATGEGPAPPGKHRPAPPARPTAPDPPRRAALELLDSENPPTAILAMSDVLALGALQAAAELGIAVPAQLSVVGFDDSPAAKLAVPALTSVAQPHEEKGRLAAEWLIGAIESGRPIQAPPRLILPPH